MSTDEWASPKWLVRRLAAEFGPFDLDPAATAENAKAPMFYTRDDDGLSQPWKGRVWLNPPWRRGARIDPWLAKAASEAASGNADLVVALVPASGAFWRRGAVAPASLVRRDFTKRLRFGDGRNSAPFDSAVLVFGRLPGRHGTKAMDCATCGTMFWPAYRGRATCSERCRKAAYRSRIGGRNRDT